MEFVRRMAHSVLGKIVLAMALLVALTSTAGIAVGAYVAHNLFDQARQREADTYVSGFQQALDAQRTRAEELAQYVANDPRVQRAFAQRDRAGLLSLVQPSYTAIKKAYGIDQFQFHTAPATSFLRVHSPSKYGDDLSSFRHTVVDANQQHKMVSGVEGGVAGLGVRAVVPMTYQSQPIGTVEFGMSLGQSFLDSLAHAFGVQAALWVPGDSKNSLSVLGSTMGATPPAPAGVLQKALKGQRTVDDLIRSGRSYLAVYLPLRDYSGAVVGAVMVAKDYSGLVAARGAATRVGLGTGLAVFLVGLVLGLLVSSRIARSVTRPVADMNGVLARVGEGDFTVRARAYGDGEVKQMAGRLNHTLESTAQTLASIGELSTTVAAAVGQLQQTNETMATSARESAAQAAVVSVAAERVSTNVQNVASSSEEMGSSVREIATSAGEAAKVGDQAVAAAEATTTVMGRLGDASAQIGDVVRLISRIADQTNLLALNATIEAARAGEAGKGFAVVAGEVKELAQQTASATDDIVRRIETIQAETNGAVHAIGEISAVIGKVNEYQTTIASAVEEQSVTTSEIGRNAVEAAGGADEIASSIASVAATAQSTTAAATAANQSTDELVRLSGRLKETVDRFRC